ncbi:DUF1640 domain-containing protein [Leptospira stimsonii]|uniref:DUF1640 domain-containing protein n=1 Tax=Leptospira stimsonii TaxID=2202203 RepID=A0ABY2MUM2_9LEPT|nr:DUF1640 domain-containing protein [Leptospira stimsonii]TGK25236.1 DUF1640 domain-containing protein [Leptospira stimsonii]TGM08655.1 DUF1640 domain-containing protein [Leptospira stimsonii]
MDLSSLPVYSLLLSVIVGLGALFSFLRFFWKDIKVEFKELSTELKSENRDVRLESKTDNQSLRSEFLHSYSELKTNLSELRTELKSDSREIRTEVKFDFTELRKEWKNDFLRIDKNIFYLRKRMDVLVDSLAVRFLSSNALGEPKKQV